MTQALPSEISPRSMIIQEIAHRWAIELDWNWDMLELALFRASIEGEFESLPAGHGLLWVDHDSGKHGTARGADILAAIQGSGAADKVRALILQNRNIALHRDAVLAFASIRNIAPPTWWGGGIQKRGKRPDQQEKRGRRPVVYERVYAAMLAFVNDGADLRDRSVWTEEALAAEFKASRETCVRARAAVYDSKK